MNKTVLRLMFCLGTLPFFTGCYVQGNVIGQNVNSLLSVLNYFTMEDGGVAASTTIAYASVVEPVTNSVYVAGSTTSSIDGQTLHGGFDLFITKYNSTGVRQWTIQDGTAAADIYVTAMTINPTTDDIYVVGYINGVIDGQTQHAIFGYDYFVTKYNSSGVRQWTIQEGSSAMTYSVAYGAAVDSSGYVYVVGTTTGAIYAQTQHGSYDLFIVKYDPAAGVKQWAVQDGTATGVSYAQAIAIDSANNLYVTGNTSIAIDAQTLHGKRDLFISKYTSAGVRQWTVEDGAGPGAGLTYGFSIAVDSTASFIYVGGQTNVAIDSQTLHGTADLFITKYSTAGAFQWTTEDGAASGSITGCYIALNSTNLYITGTTSAALDGQTLHGTKDLYISKYNTSGALQWTSEDGATSGDTEPQAISVDSSSNVYAIGYTSVALDGQTMHAAGGYDSFITRRSSSDQ